MEEPDFSHRQLTDDGMLIHQRIEWCFNTTWALMKELVPPCPERSQAAICLAEACFWLKKANAISKGSK